VITIERGRITGYDIRSETEKSAEVVEHLTLTFEKIDIAYHAQDDKGQKKGGSNFTAEIINN
jgi:type VI secretion system secreted protein Hcp